MSKARSFPRAAIASLLALISLSAAVPADAASSGGTTTTFDVTSGALSASVPATASLGSGGPGTSISAQLGAVTITDDRALLTAAWTATATSSSFTTGGGTTPETIANTAISYWSGPATATTGTGTFTPGQANAGAAQAMGAAVTAFALTAGVGNNVATWNPTIVVTVPAAAVGGTYTGTITHSVA
ncbi:MAG TPA: hypothetical protein VFU74_00580 [Actinocrinis sp.]|nr:hypothetical protein [Actinocrinis sp.]